MSSGSPSRSHQRRRKSGISIIVFADTGEIIKVDDVSIDVSLQTCLISKSLVNELGVEYRAFQQGFAPDDVEDIKPIIGKVELQWHRRESGKPYTEIFDVVDTTSSLVVLRSIPEEEGSEVFSLGLEEQTEGMASDGLSMPAVSCSAVLALSLTFSATSSSETSAREKKARTAEDTKQGEGRTSAAREAEASPIGRTKLTELSFIEIFPSKIRVILLLGF